jgi:hypothetical protein
MKVLAIMFFTLLMVGCSSNKKGVKRKPATEVDSFTRRYMKITDSAERLNRSFNKSLLMAIEKHNKKTKYKSCKPKKLFKYINKLMGGSTWSKYEVEIEKNKSFDKLTLKRKESIYKDIGWRLGAGLHLANLGPVDLGSLIKIGSHIVGTDKLGHFIGIGWQYYEKAYLNGNGIIAALDYGEKTEIGFFGLKTTGVYSYGDLMANYEGMKFWRSVIGEKFNTSEPYVKCENNRYVQVKQFDWLDYVDDSWDEGVNCNTYKNSKYKKLVQERLRNLEKEHVGLRFQCPVRDSCKGLIIKNRTYAHRLIHPKCLINAVFEDE